MNINHFLVSGNLTRDVEVRSVGADKAVASFTVANSSKYKTADGEQREETSFIDVEAWGKQGEVAAQYLAKGSPVIVEGRIKQDNWQDKEGQKRSKLKLVADKVHLMPRGEKRDDTAQRSAPAQARPVAPIGGGEIDPPPFAICQYLGA